MTVHVELLDWLHAIGQGQRSLGISLPHELCITLWQLDCDAHFACC